jgi:hypothetical protein
MLSPVILVHAIHAGTYYHRVFGPVQANLPGLERSTSTNIIPKDIFHEGARIPSASPNALAEMNDEYTKVK